MKAKADRELKGISQKAFNKTNHIIKIISCLCLSMFILCQPLSFCVPVNAETIDDDIVMTDNISNDSTKQETKKSGTQTNECKVIRVGSFEDTFNCVDENGVRRGFGYELMQALASYAGWKFEYVKCDWSTALISLKTVRLMSLVTSLTQTSAHKRCFFQRNRWVRKNIFFMQICRIRT